MFLTEIRLRWALQAQDRMFRERWCKGECCLCLRITPTCRCFSATPALTLEMAVLLNCSPQWNQKQRRLHLSIICSSLFWDYCVLCTFYDIHCFMIIWFLVVLNTIGHLESRIFFFSNNKAAVYGELRSHLLVRKMKDGLLSCCGPNQDKLVTDDERMNVLEKQKQKQMKLGILRYIREEAGDIRSCAMYCFVSTSRVRKKQI